jgi:hypothetical protein
MVCRYSLAMVKLYNWSPNGLEAWIISYTMTVIASGSQLASYNFSSYDVKSGATDPYIWGMSVVAAVCGEGGPALVSLASVVE